MLNLRRITRTTVFIQGFTLGIISYLPDHEPKFFSSYFGLHELIVRLSSVRSIKVLPYYEETCSGFSKSLQWLSWFEIS